MMDHAAYVESFDDSQSLRMLHSVVAAGPEAGKKSCFIASNLVDHIIAHVLDKNTPMRYGRTQGVIKHPLKPNYAFTSEELNEALSKHLQYNRQTATPQSPVYVTGLYRYEDKLHLNHVLPLAHSRSSFTFYRFYAVVLKCTGEPFESLDPSDPLNAARIRVFNIKNGIMVASFNKGIIDTNPLYDGNALVEAIILLARYNYIFTNPEEPMTSSFEPTIFHPWSSQYVSWWLKEQVIPLRLANGNIVNYNLLVVDPEKVKESHDKIRTLLIKLKKAHPKVEIPRGFSILKTKRKKNN